MAPQFSPKVVKEWTEKIHAHICASAPIPACSVARWLVDHCPECYDIADSCTLLARCMFGLIEKNNIAVDYEGYFVMVP